MKKRQLPDWDDGRTVADMSGVSQHKTPFSRITGNGRQSSGQDPVYSRKERWWVALGALRAALLIGLVFAVGLGLVIVFLLLIWRWIPMMRV